MEKKREKRKLLKKLKNKYRLLIINETNFQEKTSISLTIGNVLLIASAGLLLFSIISWGIFTLFPTVKDYTPGYAQNFDGKMKNQVLSQMKTLENKLIIAEKREKAMKQIINGEEVTVYDIPYKTDKSRNVELEINETKADGQRVANANEIIDNAKEKDEKEKPMENRGVNESIGIKSSSDQIGTEELFFTPVYGQILTNFSISNPSVQILPDNDNSVKSAMNGTVIFSGWTPENGYIISIQHPNNWISVYKNNSHLYKSTGNFVKAGETISTLDKSKKGGHFSGLIFELWHNGIAINPTNYIAF